MEVGARTGRQAEAAPLQQGAEQVALALIESAKLQMVLRVRLEEIRQAVLHRRVRGEGHELMNLAELRGQMLRGDAVADLPTGGVVGLAEGRHHEAAPPEVGKAANALMGPAVEDDVLVHLIGQHMQAVLKGQGLKAAQIVP